jgi:hypothetical protein
VTLARPFKRNNILDASTAEALSLWEYQQHVAATDTLRDETEFREVRVAAVSSAKHVAGREGRLLNGALIARLGVWSQDQRS